MPENASLTTANPTTSLATGAEKFMVIFVRAGVAPKKYFVPGGTTVGDVVREAQATVENQDFMVGETKVDQTFVLQPNSVLFAVPRPKNA